MANSPSTARSFSATLPAITLLTFIFFFNFSSRLMPGPALPAIEIDLQISHASAGLLLLILSAGGAISQITAGILVAFWDYKKTILTSSFGLALTLILVALSQGFWPLALALFTMGFFGGLYISAALSLISHITPRVHWGKALGIHELAPNLGLVLAPLLMAWCLSSTSWRTAFFIMAAGVLIMGACFCFLGRGKGVHDDLPNWKTLKKIIRDRATLTISVLLTLGVGAEVGIYSVLTMFLVHEQGYDPATANSLLGLARLPGMLMVLISGWLCDRLGLKWALISVMAVTGGLVVALGLCPANLTAILVVAQAAASACIFPPILAAAAQLSEPGTRVWTLGISLGVCAIAGGGVLPAAVALAGEWGSFGLGISGVGLLVLGGAFLVPSLNLDNAC